MLKQEELAAVFGKSEHGNFEVTDNIAVPHPYCITAKHVAVAADQFGGMLGEAAIEAAEKQGAKCEICKGKLTYKQHEQALLVTCYADLKDAEGKAVPELHAYLLRNKENVEKHGYVGFAFKDGRR